jgi:hypothetical protein
MTRRTPSRSACARRRATRCWSLAAPRAVGLTAIYLLVSSASTGNAEVITSAALVILFVLITAPLSGHAIAAARSHAAVGSEDRLIAGDRDARVPANVGSNASTTRTPGGCRRQRTDQADPTARVSVASTPHRAPTFCTNAGVTSPTTRTVAAARASASASGG